MSCESIWKEYYQWCIIDTSFLQSIANKKTALTERQEPLFNFKMLFTH